MGHIRQKEMVCINMYKYIIYLIKDDVKYIFLCEIYKVERIQG